MRDADATDTNVDATKKAGQRAEARVVAALKKLPAPWQVFPTVEWRLLKEKGEVVGEADVVVFHPSFGVVVIEIKAGAVSVREGKWYYEGGLFMKRSPFEQARNNRFALIEKLAYRLDNTAQALTVTHAVWLPEVYWDGPLPGTEPPSRAFLLDRASLDTPEAALIKLLREAAPQPRAWKPAEQHALKTILAPDCQQFVPLVVQVEDTTLQLQTATEQQVQILRMLRSQPRLLIEGSAGTGKTVLACALARDHAAQGKQVLLTCFNKALAQYLARCLRDTPGLTVLPFHDLARTLAQEANLPYAIPADTAAQSIFFREQSPDLLLQAADYLGARFDTLIVDEATDFSTTWWVALEALGKPDFGWYCFYDRHQNLFQSDQAWEPPFAASPMMLDANLRNTRPIGELAARLGGLSIPQMFRVDEGIAPKFLYSPDFDQMAVQLRQLLHNLLGKQQLKPEQIAVLSPYKHTNAASTWAVGLNQTHITLDMAFGASGCVRVGTVQGFKGMEADAVVLVGLDARTTHHRETLYVGASRARSVLYVLALEGAGVE